MSLTLCCRDATALHTEHREGALTGMDHATFALHLKVCGPCKAYRAQLDTTVDVLNAMRQEPTTPNDVDAILKRMEDAPPDSSDDP